MKYLFILCAFCAFLALPGYAAAKGCSAKFTCSCVCAHSIFEAGSRDVDGECKSSWFKCKGDCCAKKWEAVDKALRLCRESHEDYCKKLCTGLYDKGEKFFFTVRASGLCETKIHSEPIWAVGRKDY